MPLQNPIFKNMQHANSLICPECIKKYNLCFKHASLRDVCEVFEIVYDSHHDEYICTDCGAIVEK